jgi:hypothetical protein
MSETEDLNQDLSENSLKAMYFNTAVIGTLSFIAAYVIVYVTYSGITGLFGALFDMELKWFYYHLKITPAEEWMWTKKRVIIIYSSGPVASLGIALLSRILYATVLKHRDNVLRNIVFWTYFHGIGFFFGNAIVGVLMNLSDLLDNNRGFGLTFHFLLLGNSWQLFISALSIIGMVIIGLLSYQFAIKTSVSRRLFKGGPKYRLRFLLNATTIPWFVGSLFILALQYPNYSIYYTMYFPVIGLMMVPILSLYNLRVSSTSVKTDRASQVRPRLSLIVTALALILFYRIVLGFGLNFNSLTEQGFEIPKNEFEEVKTEENPTPNNIR